MRNLFIITVFLTLFSFLSAQNIQKQLKVGGNCDMCKNRIEETLDISGIKKAVWHKKTGVLALTFDSKKISLEKINQLLNQAGHDTEISNAPDEAYQKLSDCCHYREKTCNH